MVDAMPRRAVLPVPVSRWRASVATLAVAVTSGLFSIALSANGQGQAAAAESLFEEGRALLAQHRYSEACAKLAESEILDPAVGTLLNLGDCYEKMGKTASAWATFKEATAKALEGKQAAREKIAAARAAAIEPNIPRLSISVPRPTAELEVRRDGLVIGQAEWAGPSPAAVPMDPGEHEIVVIAPGKKPWSTKVTLAPDGKTTSIEAPELATDELAERAPLKPLSNGPSLEVMNTHDRNVQRTIGIAIGGAGVVSALIGTPFGFIAISQNKMAAANCPTNNTCQMQGGAESQTAVSDALVSTILLFAGVGAVVAGTVVFFTAPNPKHEAAPKAAIRITPELGKGSGGLRILGSF
jgi:hypothetical protein